MNSIPTSLSQASIKIEELVSRAKALLTRSSIFILALLNDV